MTPKSVVDLAFQSFGQSHGNGGEPVVILHGLLGSGRNWTTIAKRLGEARQVYALDLRNHGGSPWADETSYELMAADVQAFIKDQELGAVMLIGHSMGGKTAMRLALDEPSLIEKLVVVDIAPVAYDHSFESYVQAMLAIDAGRYGSRSAIDDLLAKTVSEAGIRAFLLQNLVRQEEGFAWRVNLDGLAAAMPALMDFTSTRDEAFAKPAIFLAGTNSDYIKPAYEGEIQRLFPLARILPVADAGHWPHAEQPAAVLAKLQDFLEA